MQILSDDRSFVSSRLIDVVETLNIVEADALQLADMERLLQSEKAHSAKFQTSRNELRKQYRNMLIQFKYIQKKSAKCFQRVKQITLKEEERKKRLKRKRAIEELTKEPDNILDDILTKKRKGKIEKTGQEKVGQEKIVKNPRKSGRTGWRMEKLIWKIIRVLIIRMLHKLSTMQVSFENLS